MNNGNGYLVAGLVIGIFLLSNLLAFLAARGLRGKRLEWFNRMGEGIRQPFKAEDQFLDELSQRVNDLQGEKGSSHQEPGSPI
ncbi:MAG: hypothetical protein JXA13_09985 [Anaerolineales bacterium]|nr:hypothetical protein [Anaerolineales bacterium]